VRRSRSASALARPSVSRLNTSLDVNCVTAYPSYKRAIEIVTVSQRGSAVLRGGNFTFTLPAPIPHPTKKDVTTVTGAIHGQSANGTLKSFYLNNWDVYNPTTGMYDLALASRAGKTTWTAHRANTPTSENPDRFEAMIWESASSCTHAGFSSDRPAGGRDAARTATAWARCGLSDAHAGTGKLGWDPGTDLPRPSRSRAVSQTQRSA
jgi:hypothetical protein